ncbi:hypothetical protein BZA05DRAFT_383487 [Tricharina praecox]|uniref:uncharacterized protein n=1 Tax=Tricharina praecox TaxID=43433 RepID=UPI00221F0AF3|nr:uncharacterized protein BZA05DRAFT_383487 [Tricharina praecox]KAI5859145.1 hypothetical protein BZA05DRAFT_383487 [Tricharina praecox]
MQYSEMMESSELFLRQKRRRIPSGHPTSELSVLSVTLLITSVLSAKLPVTSVCSVCPVCFICSICSICFVCFICSGCSSESSTTTGPLTSCHTHSPETSPSSTPRKISSSHRRCASSSPTTRSTAHSGFSSGAPLTNINKICIPQNTRPSSLLFRILSTTREILLHVRLRGSSSLPCRIRSTNHETFLHARRRRHLIASKERRRVKQRVPVTYLHARMVRYFQNWRGQNGSSRLRRRRRLRGRFESLGLERVLSLDARASRIFVWRYWRRLISVYPQQRNYRQKGGVVVNRNSSSPCAVNTVWRDGSDAAHTDRYKVSYPLGHLEAGASFNPSGMFHIRPAL